MNKFVFDETKQYGAYAEIILGTFDSHSSPDCSALFHIIGFKEWCDEAAEFAKKWLKCYMKKVIPDKYQDCVEWIVKPPQPAQYLYHNGTVGWKYTPLKVKAKS